MSDLLNQASLVMIPSGYAEDIVYSEVPTNGNGDLSFTRASNGTRINSAGLVEVCPWNEAQQSNTFGTSPWSNTLDTGATLTYTANYGTAPDGTATAGRLQMALNGSAYAQKNQIISVITGQQYTYSVYMRSLSGTKNIIFCYDNTNNISATVTTEWQRFTATFTGNSQVYCRFVLEAGTSTSVDLLVYGAQLNIGSTAKPYFPTTDRLNVPRLTYQNGGGGCPSLLLEKQSTNLVTYSEQLANCLNSNVGVTFSNNSAISPDGTQNADKITFSSASYALQGQSITSGISYSASVYVKNDDFGASDYFNFSVSDGVIGPMTCRVYPSTKTVSNVGGWVGATAKVIDCGNGWFRVEMSATANQTGGGWYEVSANSKSCYLWGMQFEASSYPTSYIPTTSASATRVADACFKTGISSLIGQTEGVLFVDINYISHEAQSILAIEDWTTNSTVMRILADTSTSIGAQVYVAASGGNQYTSTFNSAVVGQRYKCALAYKANDFAFYVNGTQVSTAPSGTVPTSLNVRFGAFISGQAMDGQINQAALFKTRLTNAELASLTTL